MGPWPPEHLAHLGPPFGQLWAEKTQHKSGGYEDGDVDGSVGRQRLSGLFWIIAAHGGRITGH